MNSAGVTPVSGQQRRGTRKERTIRGTAMECFTPTDHILRARMFNSDTINPHVDMFWAQCGVFCTKTMPASSLKISLFCCSTGKFGPLTHTHECTHTHTHTHTHTISFIIRIWTRQTRPPQSVCSCAPPQSHTRPPKGQMFVSPLQN